MKKLIETMEDIPSSMTWFNISKNLLLSESFIEEHADKLNWCSLSIHQRLSENLINKYSDRINFYWASQFQKLPESLINKHIDNIKWSWICRKQNLSEHFIDKHTDQINWDFIVMYQKLSEFFLEEHKNQINWTLATKYQPLSESFIIQHIDKIDMNIIGQYQLLTESFRRKYNINKIEPWLYMTPEEKKAVVESCGLYDCRDDYFFAYKGIRLDDYSFFNFQYKYKQGNTYIAHADHTNTNNSFGLSAWTKDLANEYCNEQIILVKIYYKDIACILKQNGKIRCRKFTVMSTEN